MQSRVNHIALELAPEQAHPFGARDVRFDIYLPLGRDGALDAATVANARCRVRRRGPGAAAEGTIVVGEGGKLTFSYGDGTTQDCGCEHLLDGLPLRAGQRITICDDGGRAHPFEVVSIRET
jgi:hypothetical protein